MMSGRGFIFTFCWVALLVQKGALFALQTEASAQPNSCGSRCKKIVSCYEMDGGWVIFKRSFYEGALAIGVSIDTHIQTVHVDQTRAMGGVDVGCEYIRPFQFYFGVNLASATGGGSIIGQTADGTVPTSSNLPLFSEIELRFGYPYVKNRWMVIPTLGAGFYTIGCWGSAKGFRSQLLSINGGVKTFYSYSENQIVGLSFELLGNMWAEKKYYGQSACYEENFHGCGGRFALPVKWKVGPRQIFDLTLEPFLLAFNFSEQQLVYGALLTLSAPF